MNASASKPPALKKKALSTKQSQQPNFSLGQRGENEAAIFLQHRGYRILDRNVQFGVHEVDIVALDQTVDELVFIEVKTRDTSKWGDPTLAVNTRKLHHMKSVATQYCKHKKLIHNYRFDIITVVSGKIRHYENVTWGRRR